MQHFFFVFVAFDVRGVYVRDAIAIQAAYPSPWESALRAASCQIGSRRAAASLLASCYRGTTRILHRGTPALLLLGRTQLITHQVGVHGCPARRAGVRTVARIDARDARLIHHHNAYSVTHAAHSQDATVEVLA